MPHIFVPRMGLEGSLFRLAPEEAHHVAVVLRLRPGAEIDLFDGEHRAYHGVVETVGTGGVTGRIIDTAEQPPAPYRLRLFQGLPKGDGFDWVLEKGTELGVAAFVPVINERGVARIPADREASRRTRWDRIVKAACEQCGRADLPTVSGPLSFDEALAAVDPADWTLIPWESTFGTTLKDAVAALRRDRPAPRPSINMFIGPEGGLTAAEVERARARGAVAVSLGPRILRTETAGLFAAAALLYELGLS